MKIRAIIELAYVREIGQNATPACTLQCMVDQEDVAKIGTATVYADLWLTEKAYDRTHKTIEDATGVTVTDWGTDLVELQDKPVVLVMEEDEYNGKKSWKVKFVNSPNRASAEPNLELAARLNQKLRSMGIVAKARPAVKPADDGRVDGPLF